jgi:uncharacterized protein
MQVRLPVLPVCRSAVSWPGRTVESPNRKGVGFAGGLIMAGGIALCIALLLAVFLQAAMADPELPMLDGRVVDVAHILDKSVIGRLTGDLAAYEARTSTQIVIVTLPDLQGYPIEQWGLALLRGWQIGQKGKNNGVVVIVAPNDRQMRIETGYGAEGPLPDATASQIIRQDMTPAFKQGDYAGGLTAGLQDIESALLGEFHAEDGALATTADTQSAPEEEDQPPASDATKWFVFGWFAMVGVFLVIGQWRIRKGRKGGKSGRGGGSSGSSSSSSSSSDSFSGGGGSGGGGGASGSW